MQISSANVMVSQQAAKLRPPQPQEEASFEALTPRKAGEPAGEPAQPAPTGHVRPGTHVDIRV